MVKETEHKPRPVQRRTTKPRQKVHPAITPYKKGRFWWMNPRNWPSSVIWLVIVAVAGGYMFFFYYFFIGPSSFRWKGLYGDVKYPEGYEIHGIDVSHYQGKINWEKVRNASINDEPIRFIFVKATEGTDIVDKNFDDNFSNAKENGFIRGAYHFFSPRSSGKEQAQHFLNRVHLQDGDLPPVLDIETVGNLTPQQVKYEVLNWLSVVEARYGVKPIIYTYHKFKLEYLNDEIFKPYPYWIAHYYVEKVEYNGEWKFWQHTDRGEIDGIRHKVDLNIFNGSLYQLVKFTIGSTPIEEIDY